MISPLRMTKRRQSSSMPSTDLDLRGFTAGAARRAERGIFASQNLLGVVIRNGTVSG
jgi:hypothetical protein